ncbi:MAG: hypothetical protein KF696_06085 [Planctomycetes bacterium]|nr:hypothetical protein [Planctomycetota bacterium]MCW8136456.1 hypothetical protein [Planctomycetota bacterium]
MRLGAAGCGVLDLPTAGVDERLGAGAGDDERLGAGAGDDERLGAGAGEDERLGAGAGDEREIPPEPLERADDPPELPEPPELPPRVMRWASTVANGAANTITASATSPLKNTPRGLNIVPSDHRPQ